MANRFFSPDQQFLSNSGVPYAGGKLFFYATGTSTPLNTYSDQALSIANTNPVVLDSNGQAGSIFLQNLAYKVVLEDVNNNQIWTMDPVYSSDYSSFAQFQPYAGNPNGKVAGVAGTQGALPGSSSVWDYVDNILYVCTTTGNAGAAVWTAVNAASAAAITPAPQGYLTLSSDPNNPIATTDLISVGGVYYTPYVGNLVPVYNGSSFVSTTFSQLFLSFTASQAANSIYDVFVFSNSGVLTLVTGPAWTNSGSGTGARGTGAGTTQLQRLNGLWVNDVQISGKNGATTYTIPANTATYLGTIAMDSTSGQVSCILSLGQSRKWGVWNAYNRQSIQMQVSDNTTSWAYNTNTTRAANNNAANSLTTLVGLPEVYINATEQQRVQVITASGSTGGFAISGTAVIGIGINTTTTISGTPGEVSMVFDLSVSTTSWQNVFSYQLITNVSVAPGPIGNNILTALELVPSSSGNTIAYFGAASMLMQATYLG